MPTLSLGTGHKSDHTLLDVANVDAGRVGERTEKKTEHLLESVLRSQAGSTTARAILSRR